MVLELYHQATALPDTTNRYTFSRLLGRSGLIRSRSFTRGFMGMTANWSNCAKVNINFQNYDQLTAFKRSMNTHLTTPPVLTNWDPLTFFTNAAELLLRSQDFAIATNLYNATNVPLSTNFVHFGVDEYPVLQHGQHKHSLQRGLHRMLQVAANMLDASGDTNTIPDFHRCFVRFVKSSGQNRSKPNLHIPNSMQNDEHLHHGFEVVTDMKRYELPYDSVLSR